MILEADLGYLAPGVGSALVTDFFVKFPFCGSKFLGGSDGNLHHLITAIALGIAPALASQSEGLAMADPCGNIHRYLALWGWNFDGGS